MSPYKLLEKAYIGGWLLVLIGVLTKIAKEIHHWNN